MKIAALGAVLAFGSGVSRGEAAVNSDAGAAQGTGSSVCGLGGFVNHSVSAKESMSE